MMTQAQVMLSKWSGVDEWRRGPNVELLSTCTTVFYLQGIIHISQSSIKTTAVFFFFFWRLWLLANVTVTLNTISMTVHTLESDLSQFINGDIMQRSLASINLKQSSTQRELICRWLHGPLAIWATSGTRPPSLPSRILSTNAWLYKEAAAFYFFKLFLLFFPQLVFPPPASFWRRVCLVACGSSRCLARCTATGSKEARELAETAWWWPQTWAAVCWCHAASCHCVFFGWNKPGGLQSKSGNVFKLLRHNRKSPPRGNAALCVDDGQSDNSLGTQVLCITFILECVFEMYLLLGFFFFKTHNLNRSA